MESPSLLIYIIAATIALALGYFLTGVYHRLAERINIQRAQLFLLSRMAEKQGVSSEEVLQALNHANGHDTLKGKI